MKMYKVHVDMSLVLGRLKGFKLNDFGNVDAIVFAEGSDPDEACHAAWEKFRLMIMKQDDSTAISLMLKEIQDDFVVKKVYVP